MKSNPKLKNFMSLCQRKSDFMKMSDEGPFKSIFEANTNGVVRREIITYRVKDGVMIKEEAFRDYYESGDYHDSQNTIILAER